MKPRVPLKDRSATASVHKYAVQYSLFSKGIIIYLGHRLSKGAAEHGFDISNARSQDNDDDEA